MMPFSLLQIDTFGDPLNSLAVLVVILILFIFFVARGFFQIGSGQVGVLVRKIYGRKMRPGQIVAMEGEIGIQARTLLPGFYWRFPLFWKVLHAPITEVGQDQVGSIESIDGIPLPPGRLLGNEVECNSFQDAEAFYKNGGCKGPQVGILKPGQYRINTFAFKATLQPATIIPSGSVGLVTAEDGLPLPPKLVIAPRPTAPHNFFQNSQAFLDNGGYRGPQLDVLQPARYYINPLLFMVQPVPQYEIPPGFVAVLRSNVGEELEGPPSESQIPSPTALGEDESIHEAETLLITDKNTRGIYREPIAPGKYPLNTLAYTAYLVPTSAIMVDWASSDRPSAPSLPRPSTSPAKDTEVYPYITDPSAQGASFFQFNQLKVTSQDGFQLEVDVRMVIRINPENAAFVIARFGTVFNLIQQIVHPLIDASFRNNAGEKKALDFVKARTSLQKEALELAKAVFEKYKVEAQNLLISFILVPKELLDTQTFKEIALQQQDQYKEQARAQEQFIIVQEKTARAAKQPEVVTSILNIQINENQAIAAVKQAEGVRDSTIIEADGTAYELRKTGEGQADAYNAQAAVLGQNYVALVKVVDELSSRSIRITPDILVTGGKDADHSTQLFAAYLTTLLQKGGGSTPAYTPKTTEKYVSPLSTKAPVGAPSMAADANQSNSEDGSNGG